MNRRGMSAPRARRDSGASAVEYGLIIAGAGIVLVALSFATGKAVSGAFLTNATAVGGTPGVVGAADLGGVVAPTSAAPTTTSAAPTTTSAAPTTTSAAPTTTSAAPTTTSAAPTTTSASPSTTSASPSPTETSLPRTTVFQEDYNPLFGYSYDSCRVRPSNAGNCDYTTTFQGSDILEFDPRNKASAGTVVTVTWTMQSSRGGPDIVITRTFRLT